MVSQPPGSPREDLPDDDAQYATFVDEMPSADGRRKCCKLAKEYSSFHVQSRLAYSRSCTSAIRTVQAPFLPSRRHFRRSGAILAVQAPFSPFRRHSHRLGAISAVQAPFPPFRRQWRQRGVGGAGLWRLLLKRKQQPPQTDQ